MIYRTLTDAKSGKITVEVEDDTGVLFSIPAADRAEATKLVKKAARDGYETIRPAKKKDAK